LKSKRFEYTKGGDTVPDRVKVGQRLRALRGSRTLEDVANALEVSTMAVSLWERGERMPNDTMKVKIANFYKKSVMAIFFKD
jgi:DNA-binding XRE family transcriptional regulator